MKNKIKLTVLGGVALMAMGVMTSCGGGNKKYTDEAVSKLSAYANYFTQVTSDIKVPSKMIIADEKDSSIKKEITITWDFDDALWSQSVGDEETTLIPNLPEPDAEPVNFEVTATAKLESDKSTKKFTGQLMPKEVVGEVSQISTVYSGNIGDPITVRGVAFDSRTGKGVTVCDTSGCTFVYEKTNYAQFTIGVTYEISGLIGEYKVTVNPNAGKKVVGGEFGCRQITSVSNFTAIDTNITTDVPVENIETITPEQSRNLVSDPGAADFVGLVGKVYKTTGKMTSFTGDYANARKTWEVMDEKNNYISFYANTSVATIADANDAYFSPFDGKMVEATFVIYDMKQSGSGSVNWRNICLDVKLVESVA